MKSLAPRTDLIKKELLKMIQRQHRALTLPNECMGQIYREIVEPLVVYAELMRLRNEGEIKQVPFSHEEETVTDQQL